MLNDQQVIRNAVRGIMERQMSAQADFIAMIEENYELPHSEAENVFKVFAALKVVKWDGQRYTVAHGSYLDKAIVMRAAAHQLPPKKAKRTG